MKTPMASSSYFIWPVLIGLLAGTDCNKLTTISRHLYYEEVTDLAIAPANWLTMPVPVVVLSKA